MILVKQAEQKAKKIFNSIFNIDTWEYELENLHGFDLQMINKAKEKVKEGLALLDNFDMVVKKGHDFYPKRLTKVQNAPPFLFLRGEPMLANRTVVSIVGTRNPSIEGQKRARVLSKLLSERGIIIASGLAAGIDTAAHYGTFDAKKPTIAVLGTPLNKTYPKSNFRLQNEIGKTGLLVSQFLPGLPIQRWNFPLRNAVMSGISIATIVMEAGETSGALIQAREALKQGRKVFIPKSAVENPNLKWPKKYIKRPGASMFSTLSDLLDQLDNNNLLNEYQTEQKNQLITI